MRLLKLLLSVVLALTLMSGCGGGGSGGGRVQLLITDAPLDAEQINVRISSIEVHKADGGWTTVKTYSPPLDLDLMKYQALYEFDGDPATEPEYMLLDAPLSTGHYTMVRLQVESVNVVVGGVSHDVDIRNVAQTGIKLNHEFDVASGQSVALLLDFDGKRSITQTGEGTYLLQPVVAMVAKTVSGTIHGAIVLKDGSGTDAPIPENATVDVYVPGGTEPIASGPISTTDGSFAVGALLPATYDIKVSIDGYSSSVVRSGGIVVGIGETKNIGDVAVSPP